MIYINLLFVIVLIASLYLKINIFILADFCKAAFKVLETNPLTRLIWKNILKSVLLGVIPYTPDTPIVRKIILKVKNRNITFLALPFKIYSNNDKMQIALCNFIRYI